MDELRIYNTVLSIFQISHIYKYGNQAIGSLVLNSKDSTNTFKDSKSVILMMKGILTSVKPTRFSILSGTLTGTNSSTEITGSGTSFTTELKQGDNIDLIL